MHFPQDPQKDYIFHPNHFLYALPKKPRNKLLLVTRDYYFIYMFKTFFSKVNNKGFFLVIRPLKLIAWSLLRRLLRMQIHRNFSSLWGNVESISFIQDNTAARKELSHLRHKLEKFQLLRIRSNQLVADSEEKLCRLASEFGRVCERRNLKAESECR